MDFIYGCKNCGTACPCMVVQIDEQKPDECLYEEMKPNWELCF